MNLDKMKFESLKEKLTKLEVEYRKAKANNDEKELKRIQREYTYLRSIAYTSKTYFGSLKTKDLNNAVASAQNQKEVDTLSAKQFQKRQFSKNKTYVKNLEKADTLEDFIEKSKKRNFVQRHFKPIIIVASALVVAITAGTIAKLKSHKKHIDNQSSITVESPSQMQKASLLEDKINGLKEENDKESKEESKEEKELPELNDFVYSDNSSSVSYSENNNSSKATITYTDNANTTTTDDGKKVVIEELNPNITDYDNSQSTTETTLPETEAKEPEEQEYNNTETDNIKPIPSEEKVEVEENDVPTDVKVDEDAKEPEEQPVSGRIIDNTPPIPQVEQVTTIEEEDPGVKPAETDVLPIEDNNQSSQNKPEQKQEDNNQPSENKTEETKQNDSTTIIEKEETQDVNESDDMEVEYTGESYTDEEKQQIIDEINNETNIPYVLKYEQ